MKLVDKRRPNSTHAQPKKSPGPLAEAPDQSKSDSPAPAKSKATEKYKTALRSYRFQRGKTPGIIEVLNENSYVMAEYSEHTRAVKWQRLVLASQREQIEKWLETHYSGA